MKINRSAFRVTRWVNRALVTAGMLMVESIPHAFLGVWAGSLADRLGKRKAAMLATFASAILVAGLASRYAISPMS